MFKKAELESFKELLLALQSRIQGDVDQLTDEALEIGHDDGESKSPTHLAELGTQNYERDFSLQFVENDQEVLDEIQEALERIEDGTYGICQQCAEDGKPASKSMIPKTRLKAIPYARNCVSCEQKREELSA